MEPYVWTEAREAGFTGRKDALCSAPVLLLPDFNKICGDVADALGLGAVPKGQPVAFHSHLQSETMVKVSRFSLQSFML